MRGTDSNKFVLTHGDLLPQNIIVRDGRITGIVDWEYSGFFPEYLEYALAVSRRHYIGEEWWKEVLEEVMMVNPCKPERLVFQDLMRAEGW